MNRGRPACSRGRGRSTGRGRAKYSETDHVKVAGGSSSTVTSAATQFNSDSSYVASGQLQSRRGGGQSRGRGRGGKRSAASTANAKHNTIGELISVVKLYS